MAQEGAEIPASEITEASDSANADAIKVSSALGEYLKTSPQSPLYDILKKLPSAKVTQGEEMPTWSETEAKIFREKLVDLGILPETTIEIGIPDEEVLRLQAMDPLQQQAAIGISIANVGFKAYGLPEAPGGVKLQKYEVNNRTGEKKPLETPSPQPKVNPTMPNP